MTGFVVFLKEFIALYYWYIELFTRKIFNIQSWITSCPDGITPNSGLTVQRILILLQTGWALFGKFRPKNISSEALPTQKWINLHRNIHWKISLIHLTMVFERVWQRKWWISSKDCGGRPFSTWILVKTLTMLGKRFMTSNPKILLQIIGYLTCLKRTYLN